MHGHRLHAHGPGSVLEGPPASGYLSNRCVRVELMALSTVAIASTIDVATNGSPFRLTSGTGKRRSHTSPGTPHAHY